MSLVARPPSGKKCLVQCPPEVCDCGNLDPITGRADGVHPILAGIEEPLAGAGGGPRAEPDLAAALAEEPSDEEVASALGVLLAVKTFPPPFDPDDYPEGSEPPPFDPEQFGTVEEQRTYEQRCRDARRVFHAQKCDTCGLLRDSWLSCPTRTGADGRVCPNFEIADVQANPRSPTATVRLRERNTLDYTFQLRLEGGKIVAEGTGWRAWPVDRRFEAAMAERTPRQIADACEWEAMLGGDEDGVMGRDRLGEATAPPSVHAALMAAVNRRPDPAVMQQMEGGGISSAEELRLLLDADEHGVPREGFHRICTRPLSIDEIDSLLGFDEAGEPELRPESQALLDECFPERDPLDVWEFERQVLLAIDEQQAVVDRGGADGVVAAVRQQGLFEGIRIVRSLSQVRRLPKDRTPEEAERLDAAERRIAANGVRAVAHYVADEQRQTPEGA